VKTRNEAAAVGFMQGCRWLCPFVALLALLTDIGCSTGNNLSRSKAAALISQEKQFTNQYGGINWDSAQFRQWQEQGGFDNPEFRDDVTSETNGTQVRFRKVFKEELDSITGIADYAEFGTRNESMKEVQFRWVDEPVPTWVHRFAAVSGTGKAILRLYDDGWRVENIQRTTSDIVLSDADQKAARDAIERQNHLVAEKRRIEEEAHKKLLADRDAALEQAKKPTKTIATFRTFKGGTFLVTDTGFVGDPMDRRMPRDIWFGCFNHVFIGGIWNPLTNEHHASLSVVGGCSSGAEFEFDSETAQKASSVINEAFDAWKAKYGKWLEVK
jgi:hypothetical protein